MTIDIPSYQQKPTKREYFTRFLRIKSVDGNGDVVVIKLENSKKDGGVYIYCDKVKVGETRDEGIRRSLHDDFGLELVTYQWMLEDKEVGNKKGELLQRISVDVLVKYKNIRDLEVVGLVANWAKAENKVIFKREEALEWIKKETTFDLAGNRFGNKQRAKEFIEELYKAGAIRVWVENVESYSAGEHTDTVVAIMPTKTEKRKKLFGIWNRELQNEFPGEAEQQEMGQTELEFWWD